ncbi:hypothetical protein GCM10010420_43270 [Streptomyces glaucosporus]|uniref:Trypsin-co-occurring domain-containing protein n=1 Tax=Streptomyces glaucosporus TaxID=284044 RepID=A0ABN3IQY3_9ACTN
MLLGEGTAVQVEVDEQDGSGIDRVGRGPGVGRGSAEILRGPLTHDHPALETVARNVRGMARAPGSVIGELGVKTASEAGAVVVEAATEAHFTVAPQRDGRGPAGEPHGASAL